MPLNNSYLFYLNSYFYPTSLAVNLNKYYRLDIDETLMINKLLLFFV
ncbi:hypothetical protein CJS3_0800 [Campylobacter jejuni subsp. jejuni S3]|nr:hypothetical protein CJS3_0800 [Campylobacter jejuni subsp. jejuni S3]